MLPTSPTRIARPWALGLLAVALASAAAPGQSTDLVDGAGMFSEDATRQARAALAKVSRDHGIPMTVQTVASLKGQTIDEAAVRQAERLGHKGIFVLIAKQEHKAESWPRPACCSRSWARAGSTRSATPSPRSSAGASSTRAWPAASRRPRRWLAAARPRRSSTSRRPAAGSSPPPPPPRRAARRGRPSLVLLPAGPAQPGRGPQGDRGGRGEGVQGRPGR